jgi:threonylcarbamoyladenosine tRNA methylthiotransferase MtaB
LIKTVSLRTLGCRLNHSESDAVQDELQKFGWQIVSPNIPADVTIINSCAVTLQAEAKTRGVIAAARRISPQGKIMVVGCYAQLAAQELLSQAGVTLVLGNKEKYHIPEFLRAMEHGRSGIFVTDEDQGYTFPPDGIVARGDRLRAHLKIQDGCDYRCAYCIIPLLRGRARSRNFMQILSEARMLDDLGFQEIVLTGVNLGTYAAENCVDLATLIMSLLAKTGIKRIRISSIEPDLITDRLIDLMAKESRFCRHFHIPLQHGAEPILKRMQRHYTTEMYHELVTRIANSIPDVCIGTDIMVGFPGETEPHFQTMLHLIKCLPLAYLHVFRFSARPGTAAATLSDPVSEYVKKERAEQLRNFGKLLKKRFIKNFVGRELIVLFEKKNELGLFEGLSDNYITVRVSSSQLLINQMRRVRVNGASGVIALGEIVDE